MRIYSLTFQKSWTLKGVAQHKMVIVHIPYMLVKLGLQLCWNNTNDIQIFETNISESFGLNGGWISGIFAGWPLASFTIVNLWCTCPLWRSAVSLVARNTEQKITRYNWRRRTIRIKVSKKMPDIYVINIIKKYFSLCYVPYSGGPWFES